MGDSNQSRVAYAIAYMILFTTAVYSLLKFHSCGRCLGFLHGTFAILIAHGIIGSVKWTGKSDCAKASLYLEYTQALVPLLSLPCFVAYTLPKRLCGKRELAIALLVGQFIPVLIYFLKSDAGQEIIDLGVGCNIFTLGCASLYYKDLYLTGATCMYALAHFGSKCRELCPIEEEMWHTYCLSGFTYLCLMYGLCCP